MDKKELVAFACKVAKGINGEKDLNDFRQILTKAKVEANLNAELEEHLGCAMHEASMNLNSHNGTSAKMLRTEDGRFV